MAIVYKASKRTLQRLSNTNSYPKYFLPLSITLISTILPQNPLFICELAVSPNSDPSFYCRIIKKGALYKNSIKLKDTKIDY